MAPAIDVAILAHLFHAFDSTVKSLDAEGAGDGVLSTDRELAGRALELLERLPNQGEPVVSARTGRIQEFLADYDDPDPGHRHWSGLWSIYPGTRSSPTFMEPGTGAESLLQVSQRREIAGVCARAVTRPPLHRRHLPLAYVAAALRPSSHTQCMHITVRLVRPLEPTLKPLTTHQNHTRFLRPWPALGGAQNNGA